LEKFSSRDPTTFPTLDDSTGDNNDYDMSLVLLPTANSPTAMPVAATTANDHTVYVHYCCQFECCSMDDLHLMIMMLLLLLPPATPTAIGPFSVFYVSSSCLRFYKYRSSLIGEDFAIAYAFKPSLLLLLLLHCDRDCFRNNDNSFDDTDTSTYNELRPQQRRDFFLILLLILVPTTTAAPTTFAVADDDPTTTRLLLLLTILQYMPIYHHQHRYRY